MVVYSEAVEALERGESVYLHHRGKVVPMKRGTSLGDLQYEHFGYNGIEWRDVIKGKYSIYETE